LVLAVAADQTDPNYLNQVLGGGDRQYQASLLPVVSGFSVAVTFPATLGVTGATPLATYIAPFIPYSVAANSAAALADPVGGALKSASGASTAGDPLGGAQLFPLLPGAGGGTQVESWSYQLVGGAAFTLPGSATLKPSVNPLTVTGGRTGSLIAQGQNVYGYKAVAGASSFVGSLDLIVATPSGDQYVPASQWLTALLAQGLSDTSPTTINLNNAPAAARPQLLGLTSWFALNAKYPSTIKKGRITATLHDAAGFLAYVSSNFAAIAADYKAPNSKNGSVTTWATAPVLVRTGTGSISLAASGDIDLSNGDPTTGDPVKLDARGKLVPVVGKDLQLGGAAVYTAGAIAPLGTTTATDVATKASYTFSLGTNATSSDNFATPYHYGVSSSGVLSGFSGILVSDPAYAQGGGDVTLIAGGSVLGRRGTLQESRLDAFGGSGVGFSWIGTGDQPWRTGTIGSTVNLMVDPVLFTEGVGTLAGGDITIRAGADVSDISIVATDSAVTANVGNPVAGVQPQAVVNLGGGDISVSAGNDVLGGRLDVAAGNATLTAAGAVASAGSVNETGLAFQGGAATINNTLQVRLSDGAVSIDAGGDATLRSITALGVNSAASGLDSKGFYATGAGVSVLADGAVTVTNDSRENGLTSTGSPSSGANVYPGSFEAVSFTGDLGFSASTASSGSVMLYPDPTGTLTLLAAGDIAPTVFAQLDSDPTLLPGAFTGYAASGGATGLDYVFPAVLPNTTDVTLRALHNPKLPHAGDLVPNRIAAGGDITDVTLSMAKQTRVAAGRDIVNMVFLGQNLAASDISRITAGRDIIGTTALDTLSGNTPPPPLPTLQGNTFVLGGPGALFIEAGRDAGPFLNSAVSGGLTYGGGIITVGNQWNPWLPQQSADIYTEFGVSGGENFAGLVSTYLTPANFTNLPGYEFLQTTNVSGLKVADRTQQVYALSLVDWMRSISGDVIARYDTAHGLTAPPANAPALIQFILNLQQGRSPTVAQALAFLPQLADQTQSLVPWMQLNQQQALTAAYGTLDVSYAQALAAFQTLPSLTQREFLIKDVYFNELIQTSVPSSPSYLKYSRGYTAVNTLFPASYGYTANNLSGGLAGATSTVHTGNLDLRLATIQTDQGGNIAILGPGGEVLAGSVVATSAQAARRDYVGAKLYSGSDAAGGIQQNSALTISAIPAGYEGVLTLKGGAIDSFTDVDFLLNQSRAFTEQGGDVALWSSNADVNAGQGPRTTPDVSPAVVHIDEDAVSQVFTNAAVSGAGIGAFAPDASGLAPDVFLMAPRGTVDAGDAGVRSAGNVFIAAFQVANADAIQAQGTISGAGGPAAVNVSAQSSGDAASAAAAQAAQAASGAQNEPIQRPFIIVDVLGFLPDEATICTEDDKRAAKCK